MHNKKEIDRLYTHIMAEVLEKHTLLILPLLGLSLAASAGFAQNRLTVDCNQHGHAINPRMYGIFFEEINHSGEGGLYGELLQNRNFEEHVIPSGTTLIDGYACAPHSLNYLTGVYSDWKIAWNTDSLKMVGWSVEGAATYDVTDECQLHPNTPNALRLEMQKPGVSLSNSGYWGIPLREGAKYDLRFYLQTDNYQGNVKVQLLSNQGAVIGEQSFTCQGRQGWNEYTGQLTSAATDPNASLRLLFDAPGKLYADYVSLFPKDTFRGRKNGLRADVAQRLADLKPGFMRWPGGCIVEGATYENRAKWKETIGDPMQRHSEWILWNYHCSWGLGYHEFLQFCEDIAAEPLFVINVGYSCTVRNGDFTADLTEVIQDIEDAIEYANGPASSTWGAKRAAAGHPEPFNLKYIELGNEQSGIHYSQRYNYLCNVLKPKYPDITFLSTLQLEESREFLTECDMMDPHWYADPAFFYSSNHLFDDLERNKYHTMYVGEFAAITAANMDGALSEAAFMTGMERNSDLVKMASYAPLIENSNRRDWPTNLIWVRGNETMGRASYYVQQMFGTNVPTYNVECQLQLPTPDLFSGQIGLSSANPQQQFRNFRITSPEGKVLIETNDFSQLHAIDNRESSIFTHVEPVYLVGNPGVRNCVIEFEATVLSQTTPEDIIMRQRRYGHEVTEQMLLKPVLVFGADREAQNYFSLNLGTFNSDVINISRTTQGYTSFDRELKGPEIALREGQWVKVRVELAGQDQIKCYVDDQLVYEQQVSSICRVHTVTGYDEKTGETIIKVVNGDNQALALDVELKCSKAERTGTVTTLKASSATDENSFEEPEKIVPVTTTYKRFGRKFRYNFAPHSLTILRVKTQQ